MTRELLVAWTDAVYETNRMADMESAGHSGDTLDAQEEYAVMARARFAAALERIIDERIAAALEGRVVQWGESSGTVRAALPPPRSAE